MGGGGREVRSVQWRDKREWKRGGSFFFFKQKTAYEIVDCDWSSDVCSSDLINAVLSENEFSDIAY